MVVYCRVGDDGCSATTAAVDLPLDDRWNRVHVIGIVRDVVSDRWTGSVGESWCRFWMSDRDHDHDGPIFGLVSRDGDHDRDVN